MAARKKITAKKKATQKKPAKRTKPAAKKAGKKRAAKKPSAAKKPAAKMPLNVTPAETGAKKPLSRPVRELEPLPPPVLPIPIASFKF